MKNKLNYIGVFIGVLSIEICIALFVRDDFIRPYFGDFLATVLVYVALRGFTNFLARNSLILSLLVSYLVEVLQAVDMLALTGLDSNKGISIIMGSSFDWGDMIAYTLAGASILIFERKINHTKV